MEGGQHCQNRRPWVEDIYWTHFQFHHFAQFLPDTYDHHLALPKTFSDNLKKKLPGNVGLRGPGGVIWNIGLTARDDAVYFSHGWQQFVKDHSLRENDLLVFKFNGDSTFDVLIFDGRTFCEKAASYFVRNVGHGQTEHSGGCGTKRKDMVNSGEEVNTACNVGVECTSPEKSAHVNNTRVPAAVPLENHGERAFNAAFEAKAEANGNGVTVATVVPPQTEKRTKKPVFPVSPIQTKRRGRPKAAIAPQEVVNAVAGDKTRLKHVRENLPEGLKVYKRKRGRGSSGVKLVNTADGSGTM